jgi:uncharacterized membrane protein YeaQ/YmgE (transglycosylase-associated protein family)
MENYTAYLPWIIMAINGLVAGWLASVLLGGRGGIIRDIFVGIIGAFVGGALVQAGLLTLPFLAEWPWVHLIAVSTVGALLVIILGRIVGR